MRSKRIYVGLLTKIIHYCAKHDYTFKFKDNEYYGIPFEVNEGISYAGVKDYMNAICSHAPRKYQIDVSHHSNFYFYIEAWTLHPLPQR